MGFGGRCIGYLMLVSIFCHFTLGAQEFSTRRFGLSDGLPQSEIRTLFEDSRGALWVGTAGGGAARYDGRRFEVIHRSHGLPGNEVRSFAETSNGSILIGTDAGAVNYNGLKMDRLPGGLSTASIYAIHVNNDGSILIGAEDSLYHLSNELVPIRASETNDPIVDFVDYGTTTYGCGHLGLYTIACTDSIVVNKVFSNGVMRAEQLFVSERFGLTMVTYGNGAWRFDTTAQRAEQLRIGVPMLAHDGLELPDKRTAFATHDAGILLFDAENKATVLDTESGLPRNNIRCLLNDRWGNLWAGSTGSGLLQISRRPFEHLTYALPGRQNPEPIYAIAGDDTLLYLAIGNEGIGVFSDMRRVADPLLDQLRTKSKALLIDRQNRLWIGTENDGVYLREDDRLVHLDGNDGLGGSFTRGFAEDPAGRIWVATLGGGITRIEEGRNSDGKRRFITRIYNRRTGLADDRINCILADETGGIWYGTGNGSIGFIDGFSDANRNFSLSTSDPVNSIARDRQNRLWAACASGDVWVLESHPGSLPKRLELPRERPYTLYAIGCDFDGRLWLGGADGAYRYTLNERTEVIASERFTEDDGFESLEVCSNAIFVSPTGTVCIGALEGLSFYRRDADRSSDNDRKPLVRLAHPQLAYQPFELLPQRRYLRAWHAPADTLVLTYTQNNLSFEVEAIQLKYPQNLSYSYFLDGWGDGWSPPSNRNFISFSNLAPGTYTLRSRVCVKGDACAETEPVTIVILRPYWMTDWFRNTVIAAALLLIAFAFGFAVWIVRRRARQRSERLRLERDVIELEQRALRLQMNPHFIFNTLNAIQGLIARDDSRSARQSLSRFSRLMREILQNSREERISLAEEFETLEHYLELAQFTHENLFHYSLTCDEKAAACEVPPLLLQPFVENAILHGLVPAGGGELVVSAQLIDDQRLRITVEDNGVGMGAAAKTNETHRSAGLSVTLGRLQLFGRNKLWFEEPEKGGTRVVIELFVDENAVS